MKGEKAKEAITKKRVLITWQSPSDCIRRGGDWIKRGRDWVRRGGDWVRRGGNWD